MQSVEKVLLATVTAAMLYTLVAPENQTTRLMTAFGNFWTGTLKVVTGQ